MIELSEINIESFLFNEELGAVIEVHKKDIHLLFNHPFGLHIYEIGTVSQRSTEKQMIKIRNNGSIIINAERSILQKNWSRTSFEIQKLRDNSECALQEFELIGRNVNGISEFLTFPKKLALPNNNGPFRVAILREQGVNGHGEMANCFFKAGFEVVDVHMTDLISGLASLIDFTGLACPGGFSYGDVLGRFNICNNHEHRGWNGLVKMHSKQ